MSPLTTFSPSEDGRIYLDSTDQLQNTIESNATNERIHPTKGWRKLDATDQRRHTTENEEGEVKYSPNARRSF